MASARRVEPANPFCGLRFLRRLELSLPCDCGLFLVVLVINFHILLEQGSIFYAFKTQKEITSQTD